MTAVALGAPYAAPRPPAPARPASAGPSLRRITGTFREPNAWTVTLLLATGLIVMARHPLAHLLGTEEDTSSTTSISTPAGVTGAAALSTTGAGTASALGALPAVPTHAPVDPFRPLVSSAGALLTQAPLATKATPAKTTPATTTPQTTPTPAAVGSCAGTSHTVVRGDSLWTLAARATKSTDTGRIDIAWRKLYAANRGVIGADPSLLPVGVSVCVPSGL